MFAVRVLDAGEDRELAARGPRWTSNLLTPLTAWSCTRSEYSPVALAARLPIAFQDVPGVVTERRELCFSWDAHPPRASTPWRTAQ